MRTPTKPSQAPVAARAERATRVVSRGSSSGRLLLAVAASALVAAPMSGCRVFGPSQSQQRQAQSQDLLQNAQELREAGRDDEALAYLIQAIAINPTLTSAYMTSGEIHRERGDYGAAEQSYRRAAELEPSNFDAQFSHGLTLQLLERLTEAVRAYLRALSLRPQDFDANLNLATAYLQLDEPRQALSYARRAVSIRARDGAARVNLGSVYAALGRHNEAVLEYQAAAELMEPTAPLLLNLADSLGQAGRHQEMVNTLEQALRIEPTAQAYERLGFAHFRLRQYDRALESFREALRLDRNHYPALNGVGVCLLNQYLTGGRVDHDARDAAIEALRRSVRINRNQPRIIELISRYG